MLNELRDRCGAQGMFVINQITRMLSDMHGISIAGDILVIYIRTWKSPMSDRSMYTSPLSGRSGVRAPPGTLHATRTAYPENLLAQHEAGLFSQLRSQLAATGHHRSAEYNTTILP
ncbi:hypothetical protein BC834DRAFT_499644 [Gloeopeniophorella convolvens]|nr:hypothetical protein BC834DRAFT_499644 [Gloeopeniophorella convolvens]